MAGRLDALCIDANDPLLLARFWGGLLGLPVVADAEGGCALPGTEDVGFRIRFVPSPVRKTRPNQAHFDLTSTSDDDQQRTVERALGLGARHIDVGQRPDEGHVVLADPEGNEFCVLEAGNRFLADCGFVGALACDGSRDVGRFWSRALDWPLVWDQDEETAIRSPGGGPKITWGGPPVPPKSGRNRLRLQLAVPTHDDLRPEVERLLSLGATRTDTEAVDVDRVDLADPDGNEFCVIRADVSPPAPTTRSDSLRDR